MNNLDYLISALKPKKDKKEVKTPLKKIFTNYKK